MEPLDDEGRRQVDAALAAWRQGDCVLAEQWFVFRTHSQRPLTPEGAEAADAEVENAEAQVRGFLVVTRTCDLVRACGDRPYVEVSPLVEVDEGALREIARGRRPNYALVPAVAETRLVADLDRVMTVEKSVVAGWERVAGCKTDANARRLSGALARKRARPAFPDDFVAMVSPLMNRMSSKHDKESDEGRALRALREIRVRAAPSWDDDPVEVTLFFIRDEAPDDFEGKRWEQHLKGWLARVPSKGRFRIDGVASTLDDLTARDYVESDRLDLDHLTTRTG